MNNLKSLLRRSWALLKSAAKKLRAAFDTRIPPSLQPVVIPTLIILSLLAAYIVALLDIGIWYETASIPGIIAAYNASGSSYPFLLLLVIVAALIFFAFRICALSREDGRNFKYSDSDVYGSAREITDGELREVADVLPIEELMGTPLGQLTEDGRQVIGIPPKSNTNQNLFAAGSAGVGKTHAVVKNLVIQAVRRGESVVTTDTKGDVWADTAEYCRAHGYETRRLDLKRLAYSDGWAMLKELRCENERAMAFAQIIMNNTGNLRDPHIEAEKSLFRACCLYTERNPMIPEQERTLYNACAMILQSAEDIDRTFQEIRFNANLRVAYDAYASFISGSANLRGNVIANLASRLQIFLTPEAKLLTATDDIDLTRPGRRPCIYYCSMSDLHDTMKVLGSLFFNFLFLDLYDYADSLSDMRLPIRVNVLLEEAANVGEILNLHRFLAAARSRGISITMIFQDLPQAQEIYGENQTKTILNNCLIHACLGTNDKTTAELFEWESGEATVKVKTERHAAFEPFTFLHPNSTGDGKRYVRTSNDIRKIKQGKIMIGWRGYDTLMCNTFGIDQHPEYKRGHLVRTKPITTVPLADTEARQYIRDAEAIRIRNYEKYILDGGNPWDGYVNPKPKYDGASRGKPLPSIIPYEQLERMALEHSAAIRQASLTEQNCGTQEYIPDTEDSEIPFLDLGQEIEWEVAADVAESETQDASDKHPPQESPKPEVSPTPTTFGVPNTPRTRSTGLRQNSGTLQARHKLPKK